jgi:ABC-type spermidine/putrescine transport system permease subunit II
MSIDLTIARLAELVLAAIAIEAVFWAWRYRSRGTGLAPSQIVRMLLPGAMLVIALWVAASDGGPGTVALCLVGALLAHLVDARQRSFAATALRREPQRRSFPVVRRPSG